MKKIAVIGCPGVGKTTFSKRLAAKLDLPLYHLDYFYHDNQFNFQSDGNAWRRHVEQLADNPQWIIDGNYKSTFSPRFSAADTIIFLDYPRHVALRRAIKRRVQFRNSIRPDMPPNWREKLTPALLDFIWTYNKLHRRRVYVLLKDVQAGKNIIILRKPAHAEKYLSEL